MAESLTEHVTRLMKTPEKIRNIAICAHIITSVYLGEVERSWNQVLDNF